MVSTTFVSDVRQRVPNTSCPSCGESHLEFVMRCDMGGTDCLFLASCGRCRMVFELVADSFPSELVVDDIESNHLQCARCNQSLAMITLACSATSHSCHYALRCPHCDGAVNPYGST